MRREIRCLSPSQGLTLGSSRPPELGGHALFAVKLAVRVYPAAAEPNR